MNRLLLSILAALLLAAPAEAQRPTPPADAEYVASVRGRVFYHVSCDGWHSLVPANIRFFRTAAEARAIGLTPSTQQGCGERTQRAAADREVCMVQRVIDGDTLDCTDGRRVRLLLIDAPEIHQGPYGEQAKAAAERLAPAGTALRVEADVQRQDRYGRELAYLYLPDGRMLNEELLRAGVAVVSLYPPNVRYAERFRVVSDSARTAGVGLWSGSAFDCLPADSRAGRCE